AYSASLAVWTLLDWVRSPVVVFISTSTSTLVSSTNSSDATSTMPRSLARGLTGGAFSSTRSPLEAARQYGRPDAVDEGRSARIAEPRGDDRQDLFHGQEVLWIA